MLTIGIIGAGSLGSTLAYQFARAGHQVLCGVRNPSSPRSLALQGSGLPNLRTASLAQAAQESTIVLFAIPGEAMEAVVSELAPHLVGKTLIDASNRSDSHSVNSAELFGTLGCATHLLRSFHYQGAQVYEQPRFGDLRPDLFYCGSGLARDEDHMRTLAQSVEMRPVRVGGLEQIDLLDSLERLWMSLALGNWNRRLAFQLLQ